MKSGVLGLHRCAEEDRLFIFIIIYKDKYVPMCY